MTDTTAGSANAHLSGRRRRPVALRGFLSKALLGSAQIALIAAAFLGGSTVTPVVAANASANLDQCANDPAPSPNTDGCSTSASDWVNGNLGASKSVYLEGDSVPYRLTMSGLSTTGSHTVTIEWDTTQSGKHALDYLTTFNRSVLDANPCLGVAGCTLAAGKTFPIPADDQMTSGAEKISAPGQASGDFTIFGGRHHRRERLLGRRGCLARW